MQPRKLLKPQDEVQNPPGLKSPFPYFGGKSKVAHDVWGRLGKVQNYVEPFFGSGAVLLSRPTTTGLETVNDLDGFIVNFWRAVKDDPEAVEHWCDWPVTMLDLTARHVWLLEQKNNLVEKLEADPDYYDAKIAGWWIWGSSAWIATGWCSGTGPWRIVDGVLTKSAGDGLGVHAKNRRALLGDSKQIPHLTGSQGIHRGVSKSIPHLAGGGRGVNKKIPALGGGAGTHKRGLETLQGLFDVLSIRFRHVRVLCGDWKSLITPAVTYGNGLTGVFLDPPYSDTGNDRTDGIYSNDSLDVSHEVHKWAVDNGDNPLLRIALCGYEDEWNLPDNWTKQRWKATGGYGNQGDGKGRANSFKEVIWYSPHCLKARHVSLFDV